MLLHSQLTQVSSGAVVTLLPPGDSLPLASGVNLYLYRVLESPFTKNQPWRGDHVTSASDRPALGMQLFYLLTPLGTRPDNSKFTEGDDAHTMLGVAMTTLQANPILNDVHLPGFDADTALSPSVLNSFEQIKVTLLPTSLDELSKIWATINQPYRLSVAYEVSLVELSPDAPPPVSGGVVLSTGVKVITLDPPRLADLASPSGALARVSGGAVLANELGINGFGLSFPGQSPAVRVGGVPAAIKIAPPPTDTALTAILPTDLDAGPQANVTVTLNRQQSRPLTFIVSPWLSDIVPIRTALDPLRPTDLTLTLHGTGFGTNPSAVRFERPGFSSNAAPLAAGTDAQARVTIPTGLINAIYSIRIVLGDGSASNSRTLEVIPLLNSPIVLNPIPGSPPSAHQITINGARLSGGDVRLLIDGVTYQVTGNPNATTISATQIVFQLGRFLSPGTHSVRVNVDGQISRAVEVEA
jgi:hypothetical protein